MSATSPLSLMPIPVQLPPAIQAQLDAATNLLVIASVFPALLVPIAIALFFFSDSTLRRKPIFILNVLAIMLGLAYGALGMFTVVRISYHISPLIFTISDDVDVQFSRGLYPGERSRRISRLH